MPFRTANNQTQSQPKMIRKPIPEDERIPGSYEWVKSRARSKGEILQEPITRSSLMKKMSKNRVNNQSGKDYNDEALEKGWEYCDETQKWTHPQYPGQKFPSILQKNGLPIPYANHMDPKGLAYVFNQPYCGGAYTTIRSNRWISEEFDTRRGRRRTLWEKKKEERRKFLSTREQREKMMEESELFEHAN
tara:strand:+ start:4031 stop:4600 length:570 start_codon:yes stop_codon:yes gene_type:complete